MIDNYEDALILLDRAQQAFREPASAAYLATLRQKAGITQERMAGLCSTSHAAVSRWESGKNTPSAEHAVFYLTTLCAVYPDLEIALAQITRRERIPASDS